MLKKYLALAITTLLVNLICGCFTLAVAQNSKEDKQTDKVRRSVTKLSDKTKVLFYVKLKDGTKLKGYLNEVTNDRFNVTDKKTGVVTTIQYQDVQRFRRTDFTMTQKLAIVGTIPILIIAVYAFTHPQ